jgi:hypothetical protein
MMYNVFSAYAENRTYDSVLSESEVLDEIRSSRDESLNHSAFVGD